MSKSYDNTLEIFTPEKALRKKVMGIVTDSTPVESPKEPEGNTIHLLYRLFVDQEKAGAMAERFRAGGYGYGDAKKELFAALWEYFAPYRARREELINNPDEVDRIRRMGAEKARAQALPTLRKVRELVGTAV
jgi:tryptophanyl-tRNA synthetase